MKITIDDYDMERRKHNNHNTAAMTPNDNFRKRAYEHISPQNNHPREGYTNNNNNNYREENNSRGGDYTTSQERDIRGFRWMDDTDRYTSRSHTPRERSRHGNKSEKKRRPYSSHDSYFSSPNYRPKEDNMNNHSSSSSSYYEFRNNPSYEDQPPLNSSSSRLSPQQSPSYDDRKSRRGDINIGSSNMHDNDTPLGLLYPFTRSYSEDYSHEQHPHSSEGHHPPSHHDHRTNKHRYNNLHPPPHPDQVRSSSSHSEGRRRNKSYEDRGRYDDPHHPDDRDHHPRHYDNKYPLPNSNNSKIKREDLQENDRYSFMYDLEPAPISSGHYVGHIFETAENPAREDPPYHNKHSSTTSSSSWQRLHSSSNSSSHHNNNNTNTNSNMDYDNMELVSPRSMIAKARSDSPNQPTITTAEKISFVTPQRDASRRNRITRRNSSRGGYSHGLTTASSSGYDEHNNNNNFDDYKPHHYVEHPYIHMEDPHHNSIATTPSDGFESSYNHNSMTEEGNSSRTSSPSKKRHTSNAWNERLEELKQFKNQTGHCNVPQKYPDNVSLGIWVNKQRMEHNLLKDGKKSSMTPARLEALEAVGFIWAKRKGMTTWNGKYDELLQYKRDHGDCLVPTKYSKNPALGRWVSTQREQYRLKQERKPTKMVHEKMHLLESIGFVWRLQF